MIEKFEYLLYNKYMLSFDRTHEYPVDLFISDLSDESIDLSSLLKNGFTKTEEGLFFAGKAKKTRALIYIEDENKDRIYSKAWAIKRFLDYYHIFNIGILFGNAIITDDGVKGHCGEDMLCIGFSNSCKTVTMPYPGVYMGACRYTVSTYPQLVDKSDELIVIANGCGLDCRFENNAIKGKERFLSLLDIERKTLEFSQKTEEFDKKNNVITRISVDELNLPITPCEYYTDLFSFIDRESGTVEYDGIVGNILDKHDGVFISVNTQTEKNIESLLRVIRTFAEDING